MALCVILTFRTAPPTLPCMDPDGTQSTTGPLYLRAGEDWIVPAPLGRALAWIMDAAASIVITLSLHRFGGDLFLNAFGPESFIGQTLATSFWFIGGFGYWVIMPSWTGATPAKMLFNLRIVPVRPEPLTPLQVIMREVVGQAAMIATAGIGFVLAVRDLQGRGPNDRAAGTRLIQFTSSRPELYRVQDLQPSDETDTFVSWALQEALPVASAAGAGTDSGSGPDAAAAAAAGHAETTAAAADTTVPATGTPPLVPSPPPRRSTANLYGRTAEETAFERRQKAALGPTVAESAAALQRTARLVDEGQLMPKVLERKRAEFIEALTTLQLGDDPNDAVRAVIDLGRAGVLEREQLERARDILKERLGG